MKILHIYSNRHIQHQVSNISDGDIVYLENRLSKKRWELYFRLQGISVDDLNLTYLDNLEDLMKFDYSKTIVKGNPPYNDGSSARNPIYHKFLESMAIQQPKEVVFVIPNNWFSQDHNNKGKAIRRALTDMGLYKIESNPVEMFETATVGTCTVFCKKGYAGKIEFVDIKSGLSRELDDISGQIIDEVDQVVINLLDRLKPEDPYKTHSGKDGNPDSYRIATSYRKERFDIEPLNTLKILAPNFESQGGYRVFHECDTEAEAQECLESLQSFWHSKLVKTIMRKTRTSTTLDNPQLRWVPKLYEQGKIFTDDDLYELASCSVAEIEVIEYDNQSE